MGGEERLLWRERLLDLAAVLLRPWMRDGVPPWLHRLEVSRHEVTVPGLVPAWSGARVAVLTDWHVGPLFRAEAVRRVIDLTNAEQPDLILLAGDLAEHCPWREAYPALKQLSSLRAGRGVYASLGNHDYYEGLDRIRGLLAELGIPLLVNQSLALGDGLFLIGLDDATAGHPDLAAAWEGIPDGAAALVMSHNPCLLPDLADRACVAFSGHTHGGQILLPWTDAVGTMRFPGMARLLYATEWFGTLQIRSRPLRSISTWKYPAGWFEQGRARVYVGRGIGFSQTVPVRLNCPAELPVFTLRAG